MDYQIIHANSETGQIEVLYKQNGNPVATFAIDVPIVNGVFLSGDALDCEIKQRAPIWIIQRKQELASAKGFNSIAALVEPLPETPIDTQESANSEMWAQVEFEKKLAKALVKFGVLQSDPTTIPTTTL